MISDELLNKYKMDSLDYYIAGFGESEGTLEFYRTFLLLTDHIPNKIIEGFVEDMATASVVETIGIIVSFFVNIKTTYGSILTARKFAREEINRIEAQDSL